MASQHVEQTNDEVPSKTHVYEPLPGSSHIRLIKLYPLKPEDGSRENRAEVQSPIQIDLLNVPLAEKPHYTAISYTWGASPPSLPVQVGGAGHVLVTESAHGILQRLRPEADCEPNYFWMDQLCIDQSNEEEKSHQIRIMRHIYEQALGTFIMLAGDASLYDIFLHQINLLELAPLRNRPGAYARPAGGASLAHFISPDSMPDEVLHLFSNDIFRMHMKRVLDNPVFSRAWIYQEIVSSERAYVVAQNLRLEWDVFARVFELLLRFNAANPEEELDFGNKSSLDLIVDKRIVHQAGGHTDWCELLIAGQGILQAKDPRDNVIALTTFQDFYQQMPAYHTLSVAALYRSVASSSITTTKGLDIFAGLSGIEHSEQQHSEPMPSWVPDWSKPRHVIPLWAPRSHTSFNASNGYSIVKDDIDARFALHDSKQVIQVRGKQIDTVTVVFDHEYESFASDAHLADKLQLQSTGAYWLEITEERGCPLVTGERTFKSCLPISRALLTAATASFPYTDQYQYDGFLGPVPEGLYDEMIFMLGYYDEIMEGKQLYHQGKPHFISTIPRTYGSWKAGLSKLRQWTAICHSRRIMLGEGQGMGLLPAAAQEGDAVCILHGSKVPVVLRKLGPRYRVVGQCYWHGWMYGDKVDWKENEGTTFEIE